MDSKQKILSEIRKNRRHPYDMPSFDGLTAVVYEDKVAVFVETVKKVGGRAVMLEEGKEVNELIHELYPDAQVVASSLPYICSDLDPDRVAGAYGLDGTDVGVVEGRLAVAENGCVWVPQTMKERAILFISESLVIIVDRNDVVNNMHEAYSAVGRSEYGYGCFISGPSKTADIAQALVMGAQAARELTVIIR